MSLALTNMFASVARDVQPAAACYEVEDGLEGLKRLEHHEVEWEHVGRYAYELTRMWWEFGGSNGADANPHRPLWILEFAFNYKLRRIDIQYGSDVPNISMPMIYSSAGIVDQLQPAGMSALVAPTPARLVESLSGHVELVQRFHAATPVISSLV